MVHCWFVYFDFIQNPIPYDEYSTRIAIAARQDLNYLAPEHIFMQSRDFKSDMFSFGCLVSSVYNNLRTPFDAGNNISAYKKCIEQVNKLCKKSLWFKPKDKYFGQKRPTTCGGINSFWFEIELERNSNKLSRYLWFKCIFPVFYEFLPYSSSHLSISISFTQFHAEHWKIFEALRHVPHVLIY